MKLYVFTKETANLIFRRLRSKPFTMLTDGADLASTSARTPHLVAEGIELPVEVLKHESQHHWHTTASCTRRHCVPKFSSLANSPALTASHSLQHLNNGQQNHLKMNFSISFKSQDPIFHSIFDSVFYPWPTRRLGGGPPTLLICAYDETCGTTGLAVLRSERAKRLLRCQTCSSPHEQNYLRCCSCTFHSQFSSSAIRTKKGTC